jgi:flagellar operon protein
MDPIRTNAVTGSSLPQTAQKAQSASGGSSFADALAEVQNLKFSNHAQKRLQQRNISLTDDGLTRLSDAVDKAEKRGGRESLVLVDDLAFIVNVKDRLVVTALDSVNRGDGVFTQIDSVVFAEPNQTGKGSPDSKSS